MSKPRLIRTNKELARLHAVQVLFQHLKESLRETKPDTVEVMDTIDDLMIFTGEGLRDFCYTTGDKRCPWCDGPTQDRPEVT